ncbi:hypothetical protein ABT093_03795 [Kitasatospora sp. NPDC002551]
MFAKPLQDGERPLVQHLVEQFAVRGIDAEFCGAGGIHGETWSR